MERSDHNQILEEIAALPEERQTALFERGTNIAMTLSSQANIPDAHHESGYHCIDAESVLVDAARLMHVHMFDAKIGEVESLYQDIRAKMDALRAELYPTEMTELEEAQTY